MTFTINQNKQFNSLEIEFNERPSVKVREALKSLRFRWHSIKKVWYGYSDVETVTNAINAAENNVKSEPKSKTQKNKFGVQVGDIFSASWGYDQTNVDFFQVIKLVGNCSVRVREVRPQLINEAPTCGMAADRTYKLTRDILPAARGVFIKDDVNGDLKRLKSYAADGVSNPVFSISSYADAHLCTSETTTVYESWYA